MNPHIDETYLSTPSNPRPVRNPILSIESNDFCSPPPLQPGIATAASSSSPSSSPSQRHEQGQGQSVPLIAAGDETSTSNSHATTTFDVTILLDRRLRRQREMVASQFDQALLVSGEIFLPTEFENENSGPPSSTASNLAILPRRTPFLQQNSAMCAVCAQQSMETPPQSSDKQYATTSTIQSACTCRHGITSAASPSIQIPMTSTSTRTSLLLPLPWTNAAAAAAAATATANSMDTFAVVAPFKSETPPAVTAIESVVGICELDPPRRFCLKPKTTQAERAASPNRPVLSLWSSDPTDFWPNTSLVSSHLDHGDNNDDDDDDDDVMQQQRHTDQHHNRRPLALHYRRRHHCASSGSYMENISFSHQPPLIPATQSLDHGGSHNLENNLINENTTELDSANMD